MRQKFKCTKCGLCCMNIQNVELAKDLDDGTGVCRYFERKSKLCTIYESRPEICNVEKGYKFFENTMSYDEYIELNYKICKELRRNNK